MIVYLGCSRQGSGTLSSRTEVDTSSEEADVTWAEIAEEPDSEVHVPTEPQDNLSQLQKDVADVQWRIQIKRDESVMLRDKGVVDIPTKPGFSKLPQDIFKESDYADSDGDGARTPVVRGPAGIGGRPTGGAMGGYGRMGGMGKANSGGGMMGGMGGMGGYGGGTISGDVSGDIKYGEKVKYHWNRPAPVIQNGDGDWRGALLRSKSRYSGTLRNARESERQLRTYMRRIPAEIINVSADEIWVIAKSETQAIPITDEDSPGCGAMLAKLPKEDKKIPLPLKHTDVKGQISGYIATVDVTQKFLNPYDEKIEAVYVFPLPQNAAVNEFIMIIGKRKIRGIIRERKEAEEIYRQARSQGYVASLLTLRAHHRNIDVRKRQIARYLDTSYAPYPL